MIRPRLQRLVKQVSTVVDLVRPPASGVVVLAYHRVGGRSGLDVDLPMPVFEAQMEQLAASGRVITLDAAADRLLGDTGTPTLSAAGSPVVITFDDGTADFADAAVPVLVRHGLPVTVYVATKFIDEGVAFPHDGAPLSWTALADVAATGLVSVGSHTHRHTLLDRVDHAVAAEELDRSVDLIGEHVGLAVRHFAYPKGLRGSPAAEYAVRRRFVTAAIGGTRPNVVGATDLHRLARSPIQVSDERRWFDRKVAGGMAFEDLVRRMANRRRYAGAST